MDEMKQPAEPVINAADYGLSEGGSEAANWAAWNAALEEAARVGGAVYVPAGVYELGGSSSRSN